MIPTADMEAMLADGYIPRRGNLPMRAVIAVCSNKGGVGKTTVATNLAIYLRALYEDLPVLLLGLDDQSIIDRMFRLRPRAPGEPNLKHAFAERSLERVIQLGQYGVQFVPTPPDVEMLKARVEDPEILRRMLDRLDFPGVAIVDTKGDLESLTRSALQAADLAILPVSDWASLEEAAKVLELLERTPLGDGRGRILLTLVDRRTRIDDGGRDLYDRLVAAIDERGWHRFRTYLSRSPRVEALNSATANPGSILHHARGTQVHAQYRALAEEVMAAIDPDGTLAAASPVQAAAPEAEKAGAPFGSLKRALLRGLGR
jgi:cellulose biosynthesis protein BcsQ